MSGYCIITWEQARYVWSNFLWPSSPDRPVSTMTYERGYNNRVKDLAYSLPQYVGYVKDGTIVGVNSGHIVYPKKEYRSRGLWVHPDHRGEGIGVGLLEAVMDLAEDAGCEYVWSLPRKNTLSIYERAGYVRTSELINEKMEYGPNFYVKCVFYS